MSRTPARPYSTSEAAALLGISASQVCRHCALGRVPGAYRPHPRMWLIPASGIDALRTWAAKQRDNPSTRVPSKIG